MSTETETETVTPPSPLRYARVQSFVASSFFSKLAHLKLNEFKLDDSAIPLRAFISPADKLTRHHTNPIISLDFEAFVEWKSDEPNVLIDGEIINLNTLEEFRKYPKSDILKRAAEEIHKNIVELKDTRFQTINKFFILSFSDLKKYKFYYCVATPTLNSPWNIAGNADSEIVLLDPIDFNSLSKQEHFFQLVDNELHDINFFASDKGNTFVFIDTCLSPHKIPSIHVKNYLFLLAEHGFTQINLLVYRPRGENFGLKLQLDPSFERGSVPKFQGWERNVENQSIQKIADLAYSISPEKLAEQAVDLNLRLMKWRIAPTIDLDIISNQKVLILGSGTLGSYVSRALMAWGIKEITFVDNGRVSYSNPVRQPLFKFRDCFSDDGQGEWKALQAAQALTEIYPGVKSRGFNLQVPMIGHPITEEDKQRTNFETLSKLFDENDVIFLLMDSRESRWLPTLLGVAKNKTVINAALGFDSYLVMRHGSRNQSADTRLGCYYCNDVVAPTDSLSDRTLDQMCTVTRPGGALIASSLAVELLVSVLQDKDKELVSHDHVSDVGTSPHQIRGSLRNFSQSSLYVPNYKYCSACSDAVVEGYLKDGWTFIRECLNDAKYLEEVSGLAEVQRQADIASEELMKQMDELDLDDDELEFFV
ncbi:uncharacterized protein RJT21DRAFT_117058 [Scheffersomyces amazonensis]|uniref:uncharacterized protein n=1 Tax=Scheffersomyces amazonensis TaxID=1078765 RepID=UPI00315D0D32